MDIRQTMDDAREALDLIDNGDMLLQEIAERGIMKKDYWKLLAGAKYQKGSFQLRIDRAYEAIKNARRGGV